MRPLRWPAERLDTLGGYATYHNLTLFTLFLAIYGAIQGARSIRGAEDRHVLEEILATGRSRGSVVRDRSVGFALTAGYVTLGLGAGIGIAFAAAGEPMFSRAISAMVAPGLGMLVGYGLGLLLAQLTPSARSAAGLASGLLVAAYVVENTWEDLGGLAWLRFGSAFHYINRSGTPVPGASSMWPPRPSSRPWPSSWSAAAGGRSPAATTRRPCGRGAGCAAARTFQGSVSCSCIRCRAHVLRARFGSLAWAGGAFPSGAHAGPPAVGDGDVVLVRHLVPGGRRVARPAPSTSTSRPASRCRSWPASSSPRPRDG